MPENPDGYTAVASQEALDVACPVCSALPGDLCHWRTPSTTTRDHAVHEPRWRVALDPDHRDTVLDRFVTVYPETGDTQVRCNDCREVICTAEHDDTLDLLTRTALSHHRTCPGPVKADVAALSLIIERLTDLADDPDTEDAWAALQRLEETALSASTSRPARS